VIIAKRDSRGDGKLDWPSGKRNRKRIKSTGKTEKRTEGLECKTRKTNTYS
tara:strand:+ start:2403 stop:2555 length:153 start_codon:yes stop_codon:yes gene_type:complete